jgi:hypothetical protein
MPVPYRKTPRPAETGCAAYLDVVWLRAVRTFVGGLLLMDGRGQPLEFVHNRLTAPSGFLWSEEQIIAQGTASLSHSLFEACEREPDMLICPASLGSPEFCRTELAPVIPFARIVPSAGEIPAEWAWVNEAPSPGMRAYALHEALARRGFVTEPFERLRMGLQIAYPDAGWDEL